MNECIDITLLFSFLPAVVQKNISKVCHFEIKDIANLSPSIIEGIKKEIIIDYVKDGQYIIENHQVQIPIRHYKGVSFEDINEWCQTKHDINELLSWQIVSNID